MKLTGRMPEPPETKEASMLRKKFPAIKTFRTEQGPEPLPKGNHTRKIWVSAVPARGWGNM